MDEFRKKRFKMEQVEIREDDARIFIVRSDLLKEKEKNRQLEKLIGGLPEDERMILLLRYVNEQSYSEISGFMSLSLATVRNKLHRAKKKLIRNSGPTRRVRSSRRPTTPISGVGAIAPGATRCRARRCRR